MRFLCALTALLFASRGWSQEATIPKDQLHIYILVGQSNMSGRARVEEEDRKIPAKLFLLDAAGKWTPATHPFIQYTNVPNAADKRVIQAKGASGLNFGLTFARRMLEAKPDIAIGLVVNSQGGSAIETWRKSGKNYLQTMERVRPILATGTVRGVLWHQGEANLAMGEKYLEPLARVIEQFREDLKAPKLPFVVGQLAPLAKDRDRVAAFNQALLKLPSRVAGTGVVRADDLSGKDIHFGSADVRTLGRRYAEQMLKLQAK
jgi:Carbohydrate esterase, sialic acid-specific acetylesterase